MIFKYILFCVITLSLFSFGYANEPSVEKDNLKKYELRAVNMLNFLIEVEKLDRVDKVLFNGLIEYMKKREPHKNELDIIEEIRRIYKHPKIFLMEYEKDIERYDRMHDDPELKWLMQKLYNKIYA